MLSVTRAITVTISLLAIAALLTACAETNLIFYSAKKLSRALLDDTESESSSSQQPVPEGYKLGEPYVIAGIRYFPRFDPNYNETGIASWYGEPFHGRDTANGERYDMNELTAAHKTIPMPSTVRVTNLENGRELTLRVNDRGPFVDGRIIDISRRGAQLLGFYRKGTARVQVEFVEFAPLIMAPNREEDRLRRKDAAEVGSNQSESIFDRPEITSQYLDSPATKNKSKVSDNDILALPPANGTTLDGIFVQVGAFTERANAMSLAVGLGELSPTVIAAVNVSGRTLYRVRLGPIATIEQADRLLARTIGAGYEDARLIVAQ